MGGRTSELNRSKLRKCIDLRIQMTYPKTKGSMYSQIGKTRAHLDYMIVTIQYNNEAVKSRREATSTIDASWYLNQRVGSK